MKVISILFNAVTLSRRFTHKKPCPYCGEKLYLKRMSRSRRAKAWLFFLETKKYRCGNCQKSYIKIG